MKISVIIPAYNRATLIPFTLRSILAQTVPAHEILVIDDGSTDETAEVASKFGSTIRVIRQSNGGPAVARNRGIEESTGDILHFFDSDDIALPNKHESQINTLIRTDSDIAYSPWLKTRISKTILHPEDLVLQQNGLPNGNLVKALLTNWSIIPHTCLFRRKIVDQIGGFPENLTVGEDQLMFLKCLLAGATVSHSPDTLVLYRTDNEDKINGNTIEKKEKHMLEWARFLVESSKVCRERGVFPEKWFAYRRRVWLAYKYLVSRQLAPQQLLRDLSNLLGPQKLPLMYWIENLIQQKKAGLRYRLKLGRSHPCFKSGRVNKTQMMSINQWKARESTSDHD